MKHDLSKIMLQVDEEITLKLPRLEDASTLFALVDGNREHLRRFMWWVDYNTTLGASERFINEAIATATNGSQLHLCIHYRGQIVGTVGFHYLDQINLRTEIGYWLAKEYEGRGIITKSSIALIRYAFETLKLHRIELRTSEENLRSRSIAERLGFKLEGLARESFKLPSGFHNMQVFSLLATDTR